MEWTKYTTKEALKDNDELMILDKDANANKRTLMDKVWDYVVDKMTTAVIAKLGTTNKTLIGAVNELNSNAFINVPKASLNVTEYVKTLSEGKLHFFRTASETPGNPYGTGSCLFMIYIINRASNGIGISINHSTTVYYLRLAEGKITYSAL